MKIIIFQNLKILSIFPQITKNNPQQTSWRDVEHWNKQPHLENRNRIFTPLGPAVSWRGRGSNWPLNGLHLLPRWCHLLGQEAVLLTRPRCGLVPTMSRNISSCESNGRKVKVVLEWEIMQLGSVMFWVRKLCYLILGLWVEFGSSWWQLIECQHILVVLNNWRESWLIKL